LRVLVLPTNFDTADRFRHIFGDERSATCTTFSPPNSRIARRLPLFCTFLIDCIIIGNNAGIKRDDTSVSRTVERTKLTLGSPFNGQKLRRVSVSIWKAAFTRAASRRVMQRTAI